jgi:hypothetical protein
VSLAAGSQSKGTQLANGVIFPDATLRIGCLSCEVICSQVHKLTPVPQEEESEIDRSVIDARARFERVLDNATLPGVEALLSDMVALAAPSGGDQLSRATAAGWLRQRATARIRLTEFQRHQHQALVIASSQGWSTMAPLTTTELGFTLRRYDASGAQDPEHGTWLVDVFEAH